MPITKMTDADRVKFAEQTQAIKPVPIKKKKPTSAKSPVEKNNFPKPVYRCFSCGDEFSKREGNFPNSPHPMFRGNDGYCHICRGCTTYYLGQYEEMLGNDSDAALKHLGTFLGYYVGNKTIEASRRVSRGQNRLYTLASQRNIGEAKGKNYDNYVLESKKAPIASMEELEDLKKRGDVNISTASIKRWGVGTLGADDYKMLDDHYKLLKEQNPNADNNQEIFIKDLCYIKLQQMEAMASKRIDDFDKLTKLYRDTFKQAGLKTVAEADASSDETLGVTLAVISQFTPEEYYKDKTLYKDFDGLGEYIKRFVTRPLKNLVSGSIERDEEYRIEDGSE